MARRSRLVEYLSDVNGHEFVRGVNAGVELRPPSTAGGIAAGMDVLGVVEDTIGLFTEYRDIGDWQHQRMLAIQVVWRALRTIEVGGRLEGTEVFDVRGDCWFYVDVQVGNRGGYLGGRFTNKDFLVTREPYELRLERVVRVGRPSVVETLVEYANAEVFDKAICSVTGYPSLPEFVPLNL